MQSGGEGELAIPLLSSLVPVKTKAEGRATLDSSIQAHSEAASKGTNRWWVSFLPGPDCYRIPWTTYTPRSFLGGLEGKWAHGWHFLQSCSKHLSCIIRDDVRQGLWGFILQDSLASLPSVGGSFYPTSEHEACNVMFASREAPVAAGHASVILYSYKRSKQIV